MSDNPATKKVPPGEGFSEDSMCTLNAAMTSLARAMGLREVMENIKSCLRHLFHCRAIKIMEFDGADKKWSVTEGYYENEALKKEFAALEAVQETALLKLEKGFPLVVDDLDMVCLTPEKNGLKNFLALPLLDKNKLIGAVMMANSDPPAIPSQGCVLLLLGNYIGNIIGNARLFQLVEHAKKEWEDTFDSISDLVAIIDREHTVLRANKAMAASVGKHPREIVGKKCYEVLHCLNHPVENCPHDKTLHTCRTVSEEISCLKEGELYQITTSPIYNSRKQIIATAHIAHNITEHKKLEQQLLQMQKMESLGTLAGGIAHDFNNLLEGILGYASYIKQQVPPGNPIYRDLETIEESAEKAGNLSKQLLAFARKGQYQSKPVDINKVVASVIKLLSRTIDKNIALHHSSAAGDSVVEGDALQLEQALLNICLNARDAMPRGGEIKIETQLVYLDKEFTRYHMGVRSGHFVMLSITDTGAGISEKHKNKIFEPFFTTKGPGKGTGLGLAMVYGIIKSHKGYINVYSETEKGTVFKIFLPLVHQKETIVRKAAADARALQGKGTILIVDDESSIRKLIGKLLNKYGYKVYLAEDGQEGVNIFREHSKEIDLVILDMVTPRLDGREACRMLKEIRAGIKVLLSSGYSPDQQMNELLKDVQGFIQKPYRVEDLLVKVKEALQVAAPPRPGGKMRP